MKKSNHIFLVVGIALAAWLVYEVFSFFNAVKNKVAGVEGDIGGLFGWIAAAPGKAADAVADLFTGGTSDDPNAPNADAASAGIVNINGTPITNAQADQSVAATLLGIPANGTAGSALNADGSFSLFGNGQ